MTNASVATQVDAFFRQYQHVHFQVGERVISTGEKTAFIYYLTSGVISQTSTSISGREVHITMYKQGAFFPLIWAVKDAPVPYDFRVISAGDGWKAPREDVINFLKQNAEVSFDVVTRLLSGLEGLSRKVEFSLHTAASTRVCEALLTLADRFGTAQEHTVAITLPLTHQQLADLTGLSRETITRELKFLRQQQVIDVHDQRIEILDIAALKATLTT